VHSSPAVQLLISDIEQHERQNPPYLQLSAAFELVLDHVQKPFDQGQRLKKSGLIASGPPKVFRCIGIESPRC
jgi:hypothetical protein